ncbi:MAG: hypothetical protein H7Z14_07355, partial [Anaerolineae bacterium]|nr:hypothetical protein [Phycisphaerae bacterium]
MQALAEGSLSERALARAKELANEADLRLTPPRTKAPAPETVTVAMKPTGAGAHFTGAGAHFTVTGAVQLARLLGWSERMIGLTIISIGTGLPEVVASLVSSVRG